MITISMEMYYHLILIPGAIFALIYHFCTAHRFGISKLRAIIYTVITGAFGYIGTYLGGDVYNLARAARGQITNQRLGILVGIITALSAIIVAFLAEKGGRALIRKTAKAVPDISLRDTLDLMEPGAFVIVLTTKCRCLWAGCCFGIPCSWGPYSELAKMNVFPVQIAEILMTTTILITVYILKHKPYYRRGMAIFFAGGLFAFGRFFLEFLMYYAPEDRTYLGVFTFWQCTCILVVSVCLFVITYLYKTQPPEPMHSKLLERIQAKLPQRPERPAKQTVSQKRYSKQWQSTKKKYKKKK